MTRPIHFTLPALLALGTALPALADGGEHVLVIQDHRFEPAEVRVPARQRVKLIVENRDATPEELESNDLRREKIIPGNSKGTIWVGPLPKGEYQFYGEFHESTAQGKLIAE
ncbi:MAG: cupredoxin domain-containing protein [Chromatiaceae bacterium]|jgi:plastocyanin